jgi:hypothetical protein
VSQKDYCSLSYGDANPFLKTLLGFIVPSRIFFTNWELPQASRQFRNHMQPDFDLANPGGSRGKNRGTSKGKGTPKILRKWMVLWNGMDQLFQLFQLSRVLKNTASFS